MTREIVIDALRMAWFKRHPSKQAGLIFHSDRGSQYASNDFRDVLTEYGLTASMSRRGNCWDNACSETVFGSLKVERLHGQRFVKRRQAKDEVIAWRDAALDRAPHFSVRFRAGRTDGHCAARVPRLG
jgi:transposase InsO family protein